MSSVFADGGFVLVSLKRFDCIIIFLRKHSLSEKIECVISGVCQLILLDMRVSQKKNLIDLSTHRDKGLCKQPPLF